MKGSGSPYNNWIEPTAGGRHVRCLRNGHAGTPPALLLRRRASGPSSRLIQALYGRCLGLSKGGFGTSAWKGCGSFAVAMNRVTLCLNARETLIKTFGLLAIVSTTTIAEIRVHGLASIGEAPFQPANDLGGSGGLPQLGLTAEYSTTYFTPYVKTSIGKYNHGIILEEYLGLQIGAEILQVKPSITLGWGVQSFNRKKFTIGDEYELIREMHAPFGFGARMDLMKKVYGEWDWRIDGFPWWKLEIGVRLF